MSSGVPSTHPSNLRDAIEGLYAAFARYRVETLSGCPCCTSEEHGRVLASKPVRALTPDDLLRYAFKAMSTWGTVEDFKHFLPRVFELAIADDPNWPPVEIVLGKLSYGKWRQWPERERQALGAFLRALWSEMLGCYPFAIKSDSCLCAIGQAEEEVAPYLDQWAVEEGEAAAMHLADFIDWNAGCLSNKPRRVELVNAFWRDRPRQAEQVLAWVLDAARGQQLEAAFFRAADPIVQSHLSAAIDQHGQMRQRQSAVSGK
jgi:hypothetical protein